MENNFIKPSTSDRLRIFAQYWGHKFTVRKFDNFMPDYINAPHINSKVISYLEQQGNCVDHYSIEVKPLGRISDEDAVFICELTEGTGCKDWPMKQKIRYGKETVTTALNRTIARGIIWWEMADYLKQRGYALPYKQWSVQHLVEFGIYKLIEA